MLEPCSKKKINSFFWQREKKVNNFLMPIFWKKKYFSKLTFFILKILDNFSEGGVKK